MNKKNIDNKIFLKTYNKYIKIHVCKINLKK